MIKYQVEEDFLCGGWQNAESDGDGNKIYYDTAEEAQASINECVEEWNAEVDSGENELGDHYSVDDYRVVKVNIDHPKIEQHIIAIRHDTKAFGRHS